MAKTRAVADKKSPRAAAPKIAVKGSTATITVPVGADGIEPILGAAYLLTDRAYAVLGGGKKALSVSLTPKAKGTPAALAREFVDEWATQKVRWRLARANQPIREHVAEQAVLLANGQLEPPPPAQAEEPAADQLSDAQRLEIEKLIAEVEDEIKQMNEKKAVADPKNIKASWEEKQQGAGAQEKP